MSSNLSEIQLSLKLSKPAHRALVNAGYVKLEQFTKLRESDVLNLHGMGPKAIKEIREALANQGKSFAGDN